MMETTLARPRLRYCTSASAGTARCSVADPARLVAFAATIAVHERLRSAAAANSIARGSPSTNWQMRATARASPSSA